MNAKGFKPIFGNLLGWDHVYYTLSAPRKVISKTYYSGFWNWPGQILKLPYYTFQTQVRQSKWMMSLCITSNMGASNEL